MKLENPSLYELHPMASGKREYYQTKVTLLDLIAIGAIQGMLTTESEVSPWPEDKLVERGFKIAVKTLEVRERVMKEQGMTEAQKEGDK